VKRVTCLLLVSLMVFAIPSMASVHGAGELSGPIPMTLENFLVQNNTSSGMNVRLSAPYGPPFYEGEDYHLQVSAIWESSEPLENVSVQVLMGVDVLEIPEDEETAYINSSDPSGGVIYGWYYFGMTKIRPSISSRSLIAQLTHENETVNLTYEMEVEPARVLLAAYRVLPPNHTGDPELEWTSIDMIIWNHGGLGVTDLVVDLRYPDHILSTHHIPVIVGRGNYTISAPLLPIYDQREVQVHLVKGPGAPCTIGHAAIDVLARPILDVVELKASPKVIESGEEVHIEALIKNRGNATSTGQVVDLMVDGSTVANTTIEGLGPGNETRVETDWELRGVGIHSVSAVAEGDEFAARPVTVEVKAASPSVGVWALLLSLLLVSLAARRSPSDGPA
jgi:hypothetical protein